MKLEKRHDTWWVFWCPGCQEEHYFDERWAFDGNTESPTFSPSLRMGPNWRMPPGWDSAAAPRNPDGGYQLGPEGRLVGAVEWTCHLFVKAGKIEFLADCTHDLKGRTVPMEDLKQ